MRFDHVQYDDLSIEQKKLFKEKFEELNEMVEGLNGGRAVALVFTKLEEAYMWVGKAIRDNQRVRNPKTLEQPERTDS